MSGNVVKNQTYYVNFQEKNKIKSMKTTEKARITFRVFLLFLKK